MNEKRCYWRLAEVACAVSMLIASDAAAGPALQTVLDAPQSQVGAGKGSSFAISVDLHLPGEVSGLPAPQREEIVQGMSNFDGTANSIDDRGAIAIYPATEGGMLPGTTNAMPRFVPGDAPMQRLGFAIAKLGDRSGDGVPEVVVSAPGTIGNQNLGKFVRVVNIRGVALSGGSAQALSQHTLCSLIPTGASSAQTFAQWAYGHGLAVFGSVVAVAAVDAPVGAIPSAGKVILFDVSQAANGSCPQIAEITAPNPNFEDSFGFSIANGGDINGDGSDDLVVGSPGADLNPTLGDNLGRVFVYSSTTWSLITSLTSDFPNRQQAPTGFGTSVARGGNLYRRFVVSGSGVRPLSALLVGAPYEGGNSNPQAGAAYVIGCAEGAALPCVPSKRQRLLGDSSANGYFGMSVAAVGDLEQLPGSTVPLGIAVGAPHAIGDVRSTGGNVAYFDGDCRTVNGGCRHAGASGNTVDADTLYGDSLATVGDTGGNAAAVELAVLEPMGMSSGSNPSRTEVRTTLEGIPFGNYGYTPRQKSLGHGCAVQNVAFNITVSPPRVNNMNCGPGSIPCARLRVKSGTVPAPANAKIECSVGALVRPRMLATQYFNGPSGASTCEVGVATSATQSFSFYAQSDGSFDFESRFKLMPHQVGEIRAVQCRVVEFPTQGGITTFPLYAAPTSNEQVFSVGCPDNGQVCPGL